ncbi:hypothetical protein [Streptacidiphilus rugosus]|uniref:hypothetical protein n=1 Tax=Streptacidiphilus rugosus TaxID=405783 RepID=UPI00068C90B6|nr:hypothetical protein [Streptacidiphilus rugosus]
MTISRYGLGVCGQCGQQIRWSLTEAGKRQPLDPEPNSEGNTVARLSSTRTWLSRVPTAELPQMSYERRFMPHAATCRGLKPVQPPLVNLPSNVTQLAHRRGRGGRR